MAYSNTKHVMHQTNGGTKTGGLLERGWVTNHLLIVGYHTNKDHLGASIHALVVPLPLFVITHPT